MKKIEMAQYFFASVWLAMLSVFLQFQVKIDALFDALEDTNIELVLCRHEQNAAFMAASYGRITGKPGAVLVTSGPGVTNLTTGLLTATTEGDPIINSGNVSRSMRFKQSHNLLIMLKF